MQRMTKSWVLRYFVFEEDGYRQAIDNKKAESKQYGPELKNGNLNAHHQCTSKPVMDSAFTRAVWVSDANIKLTVWRKMFITWDVFITYHNNFSLLRLMQWAGCLYNTVCTSELIVYAAVQLFACLFVFSWYLLLASVKLEWYLPAN